jgi:hypothetical protein
MNYDILKRANCTDEEKTELLNTISLMANIADKSNKEGLLSLEDVADVTDNKFLKIAIIIIIDVSDKAFVRDVLENIINAEECNGRILLEKILILEAAMLISQYSSGETVKTILLSLLGEKWVSSYIEEEEFYSFSDKNIELVPKKILYWSLLNSLKKILKSHWFLCHLASLYLVGEIKELDEDKVNETTEQVWIIVNEEITSKLFGWEHLSISFAWYTRIQILENLLNLMNDCDYINFRDNAEFALKRVLSRYDIDEKNSDMRYEFPRRINEFMKLFMIIVMNNHRKYDFKILSRAISKTIMAGEKAEDLKVEFSRILEEML